MDIHSFRGLQKDEAMKQASAYSGVPESVFDNIWRVESNRGKHPTMIGPDTHVGNAKGHFQVIDANVKALSERAGDQLDPFSFNDALYMAMHLMKDGRDRQGSVEGAVGEYFAGPNKKNWGPLTRDYISNVLGSDFEEAYYKEAPTRDDAGLWFRQSAEQQDRDPELWFRTASKGSGDTGAVGFSYASFYGIPTKDSERASELFSKHSLDMLKSHQDRLDNTSLWDGFKGALDVQFSIYGLGPDFGEEEDPEWVSNFLSSPEKFLGSYTGQDRTLLLKARSQEDYDKAMAHIQERYDKMQMLADSGGLPTQIGLMIAAGALDPMTYAAGYGAIRTAAGLGVGSVKLAQAGKTGAALASLTGENIVGNVIYEGMRQALGEDKTVGDYALSAATGIVPAGLFAVPTARRAANARKAILEQAMAKELVEVTEQAVKNMPEGFTAGDLATEIKRLRAERNISDADLVPLYSSETKVPDLDDLTTVENILASYQDSSVGYRSPETMAAWRESWYRGDYDKVPEVVSIAEAFGKTPAELRSMGKGVHFSKSVSPTTNRDLRSLVTKTRATFLGEDTSLHVARGKLKDPTKSAEVVAYGNDTFTILVNENLSPSDAYRAAMHEMGHLVYNRHIADVDPALRSRLDSEFADFVEAFQEGNRTDALSSRYSPQHRDAALRDGLVPEAYTLDRAEYMAEQFVKHLNEQFAAGNTMGVPQTTVNKWMGALKKVLAFLRGMEADGKITPTDDVSEFFTSIAARQGALRHVADAAQDAGVPPAQALLSGDSPFSGVRPQAKSLNQHVTELMHSDVSHKYGLDTIPVHTTQDKLDFVYIHELYKKAEAWAVDHPFDADKVKTLLNNNTLQGATAATILMDTQNNLARMFGGDIAEHTMGAGGRTANVALISTGRMQHYVGRTGIEYDELFDGWMSTSGKTTTERVKGVYSNTFRQDFDKQVALYREATNRGNFPEGVHPNIVKAAQSLDGSYNRARLDQIKTRVTGFGGLPESSVGYAPRKFNYARMQTLTADETRGVIKMFEDQLVTLNGMDRSFANKIATIYIETAKQRAVFGHDIPVNILGKDGTAYLRDAMKYRNMPIEDIVRMDNILKRGGLSHTKSRFDFDLTQSIVLPNGEKLPLIDLFQTDQMALLKGYSRTVAGEVAFTMKGYQGRGGIRVLHKALSYGNTANGTKLSTVQLDRAGQIISEISGTPVGDHVPAVAEVMLTMTATRGLGGMVFTQMQDTANMAVGLGILRTLKMVPEFPKLLQEVRAIAFGKKPLRQSPLGDLEMYTDYFNGVDQYLYASKYNASASVFHDPDTAFNNPFMVLTRKVGHVFPIMNMSRALQAVQTRHATHQSLAKVMRSIKEGNPMNKTLQNVGFDDAFNARILREIDSIAEFGPNGELTRMNLAAASDPTLALEISTRISRLGKRLIQDAWMGGELSSWQHSPIGKFATQFRTFGILAQEKQWGNTRNDYGMVKALGIATLMASVALPVHMTRVALNAVGMSDDEKEDYLERMLDPLMLGRAMGNYAAILGVSGDLMDLLLLATAPIQSAFGIDGKTGGPMFQTQQSRFGNVLPVIGWAEDAVNIPRNIIDKPGRVIKTLPGSNLPYANIIFNTIKSYANDD